MKFYVGIDIGGTTVKGALIDEQGTILQKGSVPTLATRPFAQVAADVAALASSLAGTRKIAGIGVGCPGAIDAARGVVLYNNNLYWKDAPLAETLGRACGVPVYVGNDANVAALGELKFGAGKAFSDLALITLGTGVGGGIVIGGKLFEGCHGVGTELGHTVLHAGGVPCTCGRRGCFEAYASATALIRQTVNAMLLDKKSKMWEFCGGDLNRADGRTSFECAKAGDATAQRVVDEYLFYLSEGIINVVNLFGSQAVLLGGGVSAQGAALTEPLERMVNAASYGKVREGGTRILIASLGNDAGVLGGASLVIDRA